MFVIHCFSRHVSMLGLYHVHYSPKSLPSLSPSHLVNIFYSNLLICVQRFMLTNIDVMFVHVNVHTVVVGKRNLRAVEAMIDFWHISWYVSELQLPSNVPSEASLWADFHALRHERRSRRRRPRPLAGSLHATSRLSRRRRLCHSAREPRVKHS